MAFRCDAAEPKHGAVASATMPLPCGYVMARSGPKHWLIWTRLPRVTTTATTVGDRIMDRALDYPWDLG